MEAFGIVNKDILTDPELSMQAKGLYALICTYANKERVCFPSINTLADLCDVNPSTITRNLQKFLEICRKCLEILRDFFIFF